MAMNIQDPIVKLYDLSSCPDPQPFSPNTLKTRIALNIKDIPYQTVWLDLLEIQTVIPEVTKTGKKPTVPVIVDMKNQNCVVQDSWEIAKYLDSSYPGTPTLIRKDSEGLEFFFYQYFHERLLPQFLKLCVLAILNQCATPVLKNAFRDYFEAQTYTPLETFAGDSSTTIAALKSDLRLIHSNLMLHPYLTGEKVGFADVTLAAFFSATANLRGDIFESEILNIFPDNVLRTWWNRMEKYTKLSPPSVGSRL